MKNLTTCILCFTLLIFCHDCFAQSENQITGRIINENGVGIPGVTITVKDTNTGTVTNLDGEFSLLAPQDAVLVLSYAGYSTEEIEIGDSSYLNIMLTDGGIQNRYWCCTSHNESPHCAKRKSTLKETHSSEEKYERKNQ